MRFENTATDPTGTAATLVSGECQECSRLKRILVRIYEKLRRTVDWLAWEA